MRKYAKTLRRTIARTLLCVLMFTFVPLQSYAVSADNGGFTPIDVPEWFHPMPDGYYESQTVDAEVVTEPPETTAIGTERMTQAPLDIRTFSLPVAGAQIPKAADNSTLKYFPPIGDQGSLGACMAFASVYYTYTYMYSWVHDINVKDKGNSAIFSPKFQHNFSPGSSPEGITDTNFGIIANFGALTLTEFPYNEISHEKTAVNTGSMANSGNTQKHRGRNCNCKVGNYGESGVAKTIPNKRICFQNEH